MYRNKKLRAQNYDYSSPGYYHIIITMKHRYNYFGDNTDGIIKLEREGFLLKRLIQNIPIHFKYIYLDSYKILADHIHLLLLIKDKESSNQNIQRDKMYLSIVIQQLKSTFKRKIKKDKRSKKYFNWRKSFYDVIIEEEDQLQKVRNYIQNNM